MDSIYGNILQFQRNTVPFRDESSWTITWNRYDAAKHIMFSDDSVLFRSDYKTLVFVATFDSVLLISSWFPMTSQTPVPAWSPVFKSRSFFALLL